ncbi:MAG: sulfur carrier protein ThiS [bacterium]
MIVDLNGRATPLPEGSTLADAVAAAGAGGDDRGVAVAVDGEVVPRPQWDGRALAEGEDVEVVRAVQGG